MESKVEAAGVHAIVGAVLTDVAFSNRRVQHVDFATRFGAVRVKANGYVDSSGDASLSYEAGLEVREPEGQVYGTLNFLIEGYDLATVGELDMKEVHARLIAKGKDYGLVRHDGWLMHFPGKNFMLANISHIETPLDPLQSAQHGVRRPPPGRQHHPLPQGGISAHLRQRARARVRQPGTTPDALDREPAAAHAR